METFVWILFWLARHEFVTLVLCVVLALVVLGWSAGWDERAKTSGGMDGKPIRYLALLLVLFAAVNFVAGELWVNPLVASQGVRGEGVVVKSESTNVKVNKVTVRELTALLKTADGKTVETTFRSNDGVVVPSSYFQFVYPPTDVRFNVLHLPHHPEAFIILADDASPYALSLRCNEIVLELNEARSRHQFDPNDAAARTEFERLERAVERCRG